MVSKKGYKVTTTGFWIDIKDPWLGGSPDGLVATPNEGKGIIEIKCPYSGKDLDFKEMIDTKKSFYL
jgi:hypothetical protein